MRAVVASIILCTLCFAATAQHTVDFSVQATTCRGEVLAINNVSETPGATEWNFCADELTGTYTSLSYGTISTFLTAIEIVEDNGTWYGFATSRNNELFRMDFGSDPFNPDYVLTSLHNPGNLLNSPDGISIIKDGSSWYGLISNLSGEIVRLKWTSLSSAPAAVSLGLGATGKLSQPSQIEIQKDNGEFIALVANGGTNRLVAINFHATMNNIPAPADVIESVSFPGAADMYGVSATKQCDGWEIYTIATDKIYRIQTSALSTPVTAGMIQDFTSAFPPSIGSFNRIRTLKYYDRTFIYFTSFSNGTLRAASWRTGAPAPQVVNIGNVAMPSLPYSLAVFKNGETYGMYTGGFNAGAMRAVQLTSVCAANRKKGTEFHPTDINYNTAGTYTVGLNVTYADGQTCSKTQTVVVNASDAPSFDFSFGNICKGSTTLFTLAAGQTFPTTWNYGDGTTNALGSHMYANAGTYEVVAVVTAPNTCTNRRYKDITIYNPPVATFDVPTGLVCTNNVFTFANTTPDAFDGNLTYLWAVDGVSASTERDLEFAFTSTTDHSVKLTTFLPGCSDEEVRIVTGLLPGPTVGFTVDGKCETRDITFTNTSAGDITGFQWNFGDGNVTGATSPVHVYATPATYPVRLDVNSSNGCVSTTTKDVPVYSLPKPAFSLDLPPFSCSGTPSQFHDATPSMNDSNIQSWDWTFGDAGSGTGKNPNHTYVLAGPYTVRLSVTTDKGCTDFKDQAVTITQAPAAVFSNDPVCLGQPVKFTDASTGSVMSWQWKMGSATYMTPSPTHTFAAAGSFTAQLTVTGQNGCTNTLIKPAIVPVVPVVDFTSQNLCSAQSTVFTDITNGGADPISQQFWTFNGSNSANGKQTEFAFPTAATFPVQLRVQSQSGCFYTTSKQVTIKTSPVASFTMSDQTGPPPLHVIFTNTSVGATSYEWNFNDGAFPSSEISPQYTYTSLGDYVVNLTATSVDGCRKTETKVINVVVPLNELALEEFSLVQPAGSAAYRGYVRVRNNGNYRINGFFVTYSVGGGLSVRETIVASLSGGQEGTFLLSNEFVDPASSSYICAELDIDVNPGDNRACTTLTESPILFSPHPNPADITLTVESIHREAGVVRVKLYTMSGGVAYDRFFDVSAGLSRVSLNVENLSPGAYVAVVSAEGVSTSSRILIVR